MNLSNITGTDIMVIFTIVAIVVVIAFIIVLFFVERKKITGVIIENKDGKVYPHISFSSDRNATIEHEYFRHPLGDVLVTSNTDEANADKQSAIIIQAMGTSATEDRGGGLLKLKISNKTDSEIVVEGGRIIPFIKNNDVVFPKLPLVGGIPQTFVQANKSAETSLIVVSLDSSEGPPRYPWNVKVQVDIGGVPSAPKD